MARNEVKALAELAAETLDQTVTTPVQGVHAAVATRVFRAIGPPAEPARSVHDGIASSVYGALRVVGAISGPAGAISGPDEVRVLDRSPRGRFAQAAINALVGDRLEESASDVRIELAVRRLGRDVPAAPEALAAAFPEATARLAIFIHGLGEDERAWQLHATEQGGASYGSRLREDLGFTPVYVRYNTGLHISENGRQLAALIGEVVEHWPTRVGEIVLIGHSMGGLVARSACQTADASDEPWLRATGHLVFLGSPHLGAPLEKFVNAGSWCLAIAPESRPFAGVLNARSAGIKDLRFGYVSDEDWQGCEPDALLTNTRRAVPAPRRGPAFHHIAATLTAGSRHPLGVLAGDLLVRYASATGRGIAASRTTIRHFGGRNHFDLLNDPEVYAHVRDCLTGS